MKKLNSIFILAVSLLLGYGCQKLSELNAPDYGNDSSGINSTDPTQCRVVEVEAVSPTEIRIYFDNNNFIQELTNLSMYQVARGSLVIRDTLVSAGYISLMVSNQTALDDVSLYIPRHEIRQFTYVSVISNNGTITSNSNYTTLTLLEGSLPLLTYGSRDTENPVLSIQFPPANYGYNLNATGNKVDVKVLALDNYDYVTIEGRIDSGEYFTIGRDSYTVGTIPAENYSDGVHQLFIRVTDGAGRSVVQSRPIVLSREPISITIDAPRSSFSYTPGAGIEIRASCSDDSVTHGYMRVHTVLSNTGWLLMSGGPTNWSRTYVPVLQDSGPLTIEFKTVNAAAFTNYYSNSMVMYEKTALYVSEDGIDQPGRGYIGAPLRSYNFTAGIALSLGISNIYLAGGQYTPVDLRSGVSLRGGYSEDFLSHDPVQYRTVIDRVYGWRISKNILRDFYSKNIRLEYSTMVSLSNIGAGGSLLDTGIVLIEGISNRISYCKVTNAFQGIVSLSGGYNILENSEIAWCGNNQFSYGGIGLAILQYGYVLQESFRISDTSIHHNAVENSLSGSFGLGGGIYISRAKVSIEDSLIYNNSILLLHRGCDGDNAVYNRAWGGGICADNSSTLSLDSVSIYSNRVVGYHGYIQSGCRSYNFWGYCESYYSYCNAGYPYGLGGGVVINGGWLSHVNTSIFDNSDNRGYPNIFPSHIYP